MSTHGPQSVRERIADALTTEHYRRAAAQIVASPEEHCAALTDAVMTALGEIAVEMQQMPGDARCPQCAAYLTDLAATVQEQVGADSCPLCAEYQALKRRAESPEAAAQPLLKADERDEPTYRERIAAALFEQHNGQPWTMAYPADIESYLFDADAFLSIRDAEMAELRRQTDMANRLTAAAKVLLERRATRFRERAERAESVTHHALTELTDTGDGFARGFRLVQRSGDHLDGAVFPSGRAFVLDDPDHGFATVTVSVAELLRCGYHGARIEWPAEEPRGHPTEPPEATHG
ncbi:hypothetical protein ABZ069_34160 [Streptomyces microflavus]|uniref:hypothetical protein n=1 Tax=Streptomyces microflavus TaxID=1919 RepID=UPI0033ACB0B2